MKRIDVRKTKRKPSFNPKVFLDTENDGRTIAKYRKDQTVFSQGSPADARPSFAGYAERNPVNSSICYCALRAAPTCLDTGKRWLVRALPKNR
jgi:hypothetical protein